MKENATLKLYYGGRYIIGMRCASQGGGGGQGVRFTERRSMAQQKREWRANKNTHGPPAQLDLVAPIPNEKRLYRVTGRGSSSCKEEENGLCASAFF